jgi:ferredoxin
MYAPGTFGQDEDAIAVVIDQQGDPQDAIQTAVASCPAQALSIITINRNNEGASQD